MELLIRLKLKITSNVSMYQRLFLSGESDRAQRRQHWDGSTVSLPYWIETLFGIAAGLL